ncbi:MAG: gamma-glutamylcyclotransferase [Thermoleophilaceae bacterium]|nr:gamma-glutamylcyclotransferase [Thermoleophilaceae bacterium]
MSEYVFGYGSLAGEGVAAALPGFRRFWGVAMDNSQTVPGYKNYFLRSDGSRPEVLVAYLDIEEDAESEVNGTLLGVDAEALAVLDRRERNYDRIDVTGHLAGPPGRVWAYRGSSGGRARFAAARAEGRVVVSRDYFDHLCGLGRSIEVGDLPVWDLERVEVPGSE